MPITVQCPICGGSVSIGDQSAGKRVKCPHCEKIFLAPGVIGSQNDDDDWLQLDEPPARKAVDQIPSPNRSQPEAIGDSLFDDLPPDLSDGALGNDDLNHPISNDSESSDTFSLGDLNDLDEFTAAIEAPPAPKSTPGRPEATPVEYATEYRVRCSVCDSLMFAKASQAGKTVKCSDCHSPITIPQPPKIRKQPTIDIDSAATFSLEQPTNVRLKHADPNRKSAEQLLAEAAKAEEESQPIRYSDTPSVLQWISGVFGIFRDLSVITHWIGLSIVAAVPTVFAIMVDHHYVYTMMVPAGLFFGALVVSCGFAILQSVANGEKQVSEWPILDPSSWLGELVVAIAAAAIVARPLPPSHIC